MECAEERMGGPHDMTCLVTRSIVPLSAIDIHYWAYCDVIMSAQPLQLTDNDQPAGQ